MGSNLYHTIPTFFENRMREHSAVSAVRRLHVEGEFVYEVDRCNFGDTICVWLSDAYIFTEMDYYNRPKELKAGDYILIAKPEGGGQVDKAIIDAAQIGVGKIGELMGALNVQCMWTYVPPRREKKLGEEESVKICDFSTLFSVLLRHSNPDLIGLSCQLH